MKRCETLVVTRDESKSTLRRLEAEIVSEEDGLIAFKDVMNEKILKLRYARVHLLGHGWKVDRPGCAGTFPWSHFLKCT